jgi:hypothetical protein
VSERIRPYRAEDAAAVREVHLQAFDGRGDELRLVELLHAAGAAPVSLVAAAEPDGRVVGHLPALSLRGEGRAEHRQVACGGAAQALRGLPRTPATAAVRAGLPRRGGVAEGPEAGRLRAQEARFAPGPPAAPLSVPRGLGLSLCARSPRAHLGVSQGLRRGLLREAQVLPDGRQRELHDRRVEDDHEVPEAEDEEREPANPPSGFIGRPYSS